MRFLDSFATTDTTAQGEHEIRVWIAAMAAAIQAKDRSPYDVADEAVQAFRERLPKSAEGR